MTFDPRYFKPMVVIDTCAVWNILSAQKLYRAANTAKLTFLMTPMVLYECAYKPRNEPSPEQIELSKRFRSAREDGAFTIQACALDDLLAVSLNAPVALGSGELSCIAMAYRMSTVAVMTDDLQARRYAESKISLRVETTPRLYGWLHYCRHLSDGDHPEIMAEHERYERRPLTSFFNEAYTSSLEYRLMDSS
ncbi:hypothetical protein [Acidithiobacillus ferriphilus]|uniref:hypothetical protein n=1 Tax=Acidithiobacillus ferriphilus TaxID=1689834 RepID=UPI0040568910